MGEPVLRKLSAVLGGATMEPFGWSLQFSKRAPADGAAKPFGGAFVLGLSGVVRPSPRGHERHWVLLGGLQFSRREGGEDIRDLGKEAPSFLAKNSLVAFSHRESFVRLLLDLHEPKHMPVV